MFYDASIGGHKGDCCRSGSGDNQCSRMNGIDRWWQRIVEHYTETARHYHTLDHVKDMMRLFREHCDGLVASPAAIVLAIVFHE